MTRSELRKLFHRENAKFAKVFGRVPVVLVFNGKCSGHCVYRDFALTDWPMLGPAKIIFYERALSLPRKNLIALIRHELGHVYDPMVDSRGSEQRADDIAEYVTGVAIQYDQDDVQTISRGKYPRPDKLPK